MGLKKLIKKLAVAFEKNKINYMIIGGQALLIYGEPRLTKDIDITIDAGVEKIDSVLKIAKSLKLKPLCADSAEFAKETMVLPLLDEGTGIRIDLIFSYSAYEKEALKRVKKVKIENVFVNYVSVEDLIIHKIISGREKDFEDIESILFKNRKIDKKYILKWLGEFENVSGEELKEKFLNLLKEVKKWKF